MHDPAARGEDLVTLCNYSQQAKRSGYYWFPKSDKWEEADCWEGGFAEIQGEDMIIQRVRFDILCIFRNYPLNISMIWCFWMQTYSSKFVEMS